MLTTTRMTVALACAALASCATAPKPLYYWGSYQDATYGYLKRDESPEAQLAQLDETLAQAQSSGLPLPPGFMAQMGLLYVATGQAAKAQLAFQTEETRFPEAKTYMDFLLKKPPAVTKTKPAPAPAKPPATPAKPSANTAPTAASAAPGSAQK